MDAVEARTLQSGGKLLNYSFIDKDIKKALMKGRQSFHFFNPKLIIPTLVLHARGKDGSLLP